MRRLAAVCVTALLMAALTPASAGAAVPGKPFTETGCENYSDSVARLYTAGLGREPEQGGFEFWMAEYTAGRWDLPSMATFFTQSPEFAESYGDLTNDGFIRQLYRNVLAREGESGGITFWNQQMALGMDRGTVLLRFAESPENITNSGTVEPELGPFNAGRLGPWTCAQPAADPGNAPTGQTPADALPFGTAFSHQSRFSDDAFNGTVVALVEGERRSGNDDEGRCLIVVGTFTPTSIDEGNVSRSFTAPDISLIAGGERVNNTILQCDWDPFEEAGWRWALRANTTLGTSYPFFEEIFLPADGPQAPDAIAVGNPASNDAIYFQANTVSSIPGAGVQPSGPNTFLAAQPNLGAPFTIREPFRDVEWEGQITAVVQGTPRGDNTGTCLYVLGSITPTEIDEGLVTSGFESPQINLLNRVRVIEDTILNCEADPIEAAGWDWILRAEVTVGTTYNFYEEFYIEPGNTLDLQAVLVGPPATAEALFFNVSAPSPGIPAAN